MCVFVFVCAKKCVPRGENTHCSKLSPPFSAMAGAGWVLRPNMAQQRASRIGRFSPLRALALDFDFKNRAVFPQERKKEYFGIITRTKNKQKKNISLSGIKMSQKLKSFLQLLPMTEVPSS